RGCPCHEARAGLAPTESYTNRRTERGRGEPAMRDSYRGGHRLPPTSGGPDGQRFLEQLQRVRRAEDARELVSDAIKHPRRHQARGNQEGLDLVGTVAAMDLVVDGLVEGDEPRLARVVGG
ncbi:hypothetical protein L0F63_004924, partial [Massospora cicadina]